MFENTTVYDKSAAKALAFVWSRKEPRLLNLLQSRRHTILGGMCMAGGLILLGFAWSGSDGRVFIVLYLLVGVIALTMGGLLFFRRPMARWWFEWGILRGLRKGREPLERRRTFHEDFYWSSAEGGRQYGYETLKTVYEVNGFFIWEMTDGWGALNQSGFTQGTPEDFRDFLERKLRRPVERIK